MKGEPGRLPALLGGDGKNEISTTLGDVDIMDCLDIDGVKPEGTFDVASDTTSIPDEE